MPIQEQYETGTPCWVDYAATDAPGAKAFYGELFGWTFHSDGPAGYEVVRLGDEVVGGFGRAPSGRGSWNTYLAVKDIGALAVRLRQGGGTVVFGPVRAGHDGRLLFAVDPAGAAVGFWEGGRPTGIVLVAEPGTWCHHELWTADAAAAGDFYRGALGGPVRTPAVPWPAGVEHTARWVTFFMAGDVEALLAAAKRRGAAIAGRHGNATILRDPWDAVFAVLPSG